MPVGIHGSYAYGIPALHRTVHCGFRANYPFLFQEEGMLLVIDIK